MMYADDETNIQKTVQDALDLIIDPRVSISDVLNPALITALFINKNKYLLREFQVRLQQEMHKIPLLTNETNEQLSAKIDNILSFIAYTEPTNGACIYIPTLIDEAFENIRYTIQRINLTSDYLSAPYPCYGLIPPLSHSNVPARIIFLGTTFPTAKGFVQTLMADTAPGGGVGHFLYMQGGSDLKAWINEQFEKTKQAIHCCGQSLGGAMCIQTYIHQPNKVEFTAINPPFLTNAERRALNESSIAQKDWTRKNQIFSHVQDPIGRIGHWFPPNTDVYIYGTENDFEGSEINKYFKAHAAQLTTSHFIKHTGQVYHAILKQQPYRMLVHYSLKPIRAAAFFSFAASTAASSIARSIGKGSGSIPIQAQGSQQLPKSEETSKISTVSSLV